MPSDSKNLDPRGPWSFDLPELQPGESWDADFANRSHNKRKGYFKPFLPFDYAQVTNQSVDNNIRVVLNGTKYEDVVVANAIETYEDIDVMDVRVFNEGSTAIDAENVVVSVGNSGFDADDMARKKARQGPVGGVVEHLTGLNINGL